MKVVTERFDEHNSQTYILTVSITKQMQRIEKKFQKSEVIRLT